MPFSILYKYYVMSCLKLLPYIYMVSLKTNSSSFMKFLKANHIIQSYLGCYTTGMLMYCMVLMLCCQICSNIVPHKQGIGIAVVHLVFSRQYCSVQ